MPTLAEATRYNLAKFEPVQRMDKPPSPYVQTYPAAPNPFLRAAVPQIGNAGPDSQRSYYNGGRVPQTRVPILNQLGNPFK